MYESVHSLARDHWRRDHSFRCSRLKTMVFTSHIWGVISRLKFNSRVFEGHKVTTQKAVLGKQGQKRHREAGWPLAIGPRIYNTCQGVNNVLFSVADEHYYIYYILQHNTHTISAKVLAIPLKGCIFKFHEV